MLNDALRFNEMQYSKAARMHRKLIGGCEQMGENMEG